MEALNPDVPFEKSADLQERPYYQISKGTLLLSQGKYGETLALGREALEARSSLGPVCPAVREGFVIGAEAALALDDLEAVDALLAVPEGFGQSDLTPSWRGQVDRLTARLASERGELDRVEPKFKAAAAYFQEINTPYWLAVTLAEHAEWLFGQDRVNEAEPLLAEARAIFERLKARPWLERLRSFEDSPTAATGRRTAEAT